MNLPSVTLAYTCVSTSPSADTLAKQFAETYRKFPPGYPHRLVVVCNGGEPDEYVKSAFKGLQSAFFPRGNTGWDIGGYLELSRWLETDLQVCLGESVHFWRAGGLARIVAAWQRNGPGLYGCFSSFLVRPHLNTTAFACTPELLAGQPPVVTKRDRYQFEHGETAFWTKVRKLGLATRLVTWSGDYGENDWRKPENIMWRGDQSNCLVRCHHTERYRTAQPAEKQMLSENADGLRKVQPVEDLLPA